MEERAGSTSQPLAARKKSERAFEDIKRFILAMVNVRWRPAARLDDRMP